MKDAVIESVGAGRFWEVNATRLATALMGDAIASNMFMLGYAWQKGLVPVSEEALMEAIRLNGAAVKFNQQAFIWGRHAAHDPGRVEALTNPSSVVQFVPRETLDGVLHHRAKELTNYQNQALAERYKALVGKVQAAEQAINPASSSAVTGGGPCLLPRAGLQGRVRSGPPVYRRRLPARAASQFDGDYQLRFHIGASWVTGGVAKKIAFGPWLFKGMKLLARLRFLRGTALDPFGWQADRKLERRLIGEFEQLITTLLSG
jgi:indolepyruvate ferredoxin oxidoreductase